jgi:hypothetical protein
VDAATAHLAEGALGLLGGYGSDSGEED